MVTPFKDVVGEIKIVIDEKGGNNEQDLEKKVSAMEGGPQNDMLLSDFDQFDIQRKKSRKKSYSSKAYYEVSC